MENAQGAVVLIPSLEPDGRLYPYVRRLVESGFRVVVVDDGSGARYRPVFDAIAALSGCHVARHDVNRGKGAALKTGYAYIAANLPCTGVVTADADGQHRVEDVCALAGRLAAGETGLWLGTRDFSLKHVPFKSRAGNRITSTMFLLFYGKWLPDTQTGLRAFPAALLDFMREIPGDRFEYEMNVLIYCAGKKVPLHTLPIHTIYENENRGSHFHALHDSWRIYKLIFRNIFKFASVSFLATVIDQALFFLLNRALLPQAVYMDLVRRLDLPVYMNRVLLITMIARVVSAGFNFILNRQYVFHVKRRSSLPKYLLLCVAVMLASAGGVNLLTHALPMGETVAKIIVDGALFFVNYRIQKAWVFAEKRRKLL